MAHTISMEDNSGKKKSKKELAIIKTVEDMQNLSEQEYNDAMRIIRDTSVCRRDRLRRMKNLRRDVFPPFNPV